MIFPALNKTNTPHIYTLKPSHYYGGDLMQSLDMSPTEQHWLIKWLAHPMQNPGAKIPKAILFHAPADSAWFSGITLAIINHEFWPTNVSPLKTVLKQLITNDQIEIRRKAHSPHSIKNELNFIFFTGAAQSTFSERRFQYFRLKKAEGAAA